MAPSPAPLWKPLLAWCVATLVLAGVFGLYLQPDFMVDLAQQLWACF